MKTTTTKFMLLLAALTMAAAAASGQEEKTVALPEVQIAAARTIQQPDGLWLYPSTQQLAHSTSTYGLLSQLSLPHIRVDEATATICALTHLGSVQVRINDVVATRADLLSLDVQRIQRVEYIDNPGVRYGDDYAYVINIRLRKPTGGHTLGARLANTLTTTNGSESVYAKLNRGRSEWALDYSLDYHRFGGLQTDEHATYLLADGTALAQHRQTLQSRSSHLSHEAQLTYSLSDSTYTFQAKLMGSGDLQPQRHTATMALNNQPYTDCSTSREHSPSLDLYYHQQLDSQHTLTANLVGTYIKTQGDTEDDEGGDYRYHIEGHTYTLWGEALYEHRLKPFALTLGAQLSQRYSHNRYTGDAEATNDVHTSAVYGFAQAKGQLGRLTYVAALGLSHRYYRQGSAVQHFWTWRPKLSLTLPLGRNWRLRYDAEQTQRVSQVALVSDVSIKRNSMETILGNPDIQPTRVVNQDLRLTYSTSRVTTELHGFYRHNAHCNMEKYIREADHFYYTQTNADNRCDFFYVESNNQWDIIPQRLSASIYGGIYRFFNYGEDYTHTYTAFNGGGSVQAYLKRWTLGLYADNGWNFMEGEHRGHQAPAWYLTASYRASDAITLSLYAQHLFSAHPLTNKTEVVSRYVGKQSSQHAADYGNMLTLSVSIRLNRGQQYRDISRTMNHADHETGILAK